MYQKGQALMYVLKTVRHMLDSMQTAEHYRVCNSEQALLRIVQAEIQWASDELPICVEPELVEVWYNWLTGDAKGLVAAWNSLCSNVFFEIIEAEEASKTKQPGIPSAIVPFSRCEYTHVECQDYLEGCMEMVCKPPPQNAYADTWYTYNMWQVWD